MSYQPLTGKAKQAIDLPSTSIDAFEGSVRSGKTFTSLLVWLQFILNGPKGALAMVGRTERTVINNLVIPLQEMLGAHRVTINYGSGTTKILGRTVNLYGADNEAARTKVQGLTLAGAYVDEAAEIPESFFNMLYSRLSVPGAKLFLTCNPAGPKHWLKTGWLDRAALWVHADGSVTRNDDDSTLELHRYTFVIDDNPALTPEYVARQKNSYTGVFYRRMILGEWAAADGAVYESFDAEKHTIKPDDMPDMDRVFMLGIDYGSRQNTRGILVGIGKEPDGINRLYAIAEWAPPNGTVAQHVEHLQAWLADRPEPEWIAYDPAAAVFGTQLFHDGISRVRKADNRVMDGIRTVDSLIAADRLRISTTCRHLLDELPGYVWDARAAEHGEDAVKKHAGHSCDALRYAVFTGRAVGHHLIDYTPTPTGGPTT